MLECLENSGQGKDLPPENQSRRVGGEGLVGNPQLTPSIREFTDAGYKTGNPRLGIEIVSSEIVKVKKKKAERRR